MKETKFDRAIAALSMVGGIVTIFGLFLGPMFWLGSKIDNVNYSLNQKIDNSNIVLNQKIDEFKDEVNAEMKDFHGRLCAIEERRGK